MNVRSCSWEGQGGILSITAGGPPVELLVSGIGWCHADTLYTLSHQSTVGSFDSISWRVIELQADVRSRGPRDAVLVIEVENETYEVDPGEYDGRTSVSTWFVPKKLIASPERLEGKERVDFEHFLLAGVACRIDSPTLSLVDAAGGSIPSVPVESIAFDVRTRLVEAAARVARRAGFILGGEPLAAAYLYSESEPASNANETIACWWTWRLAFSVDDGGLLTVQAAATAIDAHEADSPVDFDVVLEAWLAFPGSVECMTLSCPGVPIVANDKF